MYDSCNLSDKSLFLSVSFLSLLSLTSLHLLPLLSLFSLASLISLFRPLLFSLSFLLPLFVFLPVLSLFFLSFPSPLSFPFFTLCSSFSFHFFSLFCSLSFPSAFSSFCPIFPSPPYFFFTSHLLPPLLLPLICIIICNCYFMFYNILSTDID